MAKKAAFYQLAKVAYIYENKSFKEIALELSEAGGPSEKTIRLWAAEGNWKEKRQKYLESQKDFKEKLDELKLVLINAAIETKDLQVIYALSSLLKSTQTGKTTAKDIKEKVDKDKEEGGLSDEAIELIKKEILGIE